MKKLILIGGGGHCKSTIDILMNNKEYNDIVILDKSENVGKKICGCEVVGTDDEMEYLVQKGYHHAFITVGSIKSTELRRILWEKAIKSKLHLINVIDKTAVIADDVTLGRGIFIGKMAVINTGVMIQDMSIINTGAIIEHDCVIQEFCHVSVGAVLCGGVLIEHDSFIGANATVIQEVILQANSVIGAGSVVLKQGQVVDKQSPVI